MSFELFVGCADEVENKGLTGQSLVRGSAGVPSASLESPLSPAKGRGVGG